MRPVTTSVERLLRQEPFVSTTFTQSSTTLSRPQRNSTPTTSFGWMTSGESDCPSLLLIHGRLVFCRLGIDRFIGWSPILEKKLLLHITVRLRQSHPCRPRLLRHLPPRLPRFWGAARLRQRPTSGRSRDGKGKGDGRTQCVTQHSASYVSSVAHVSCMWYHGIRESLERSTYGHTTRRTRSGCLTA
ncbi:MAG: hypothetical protein JWL77_3532 [Chthonomonadaceae bacterium]|nr:hypothetical protein [Chthonomonadaceae bacterium]